MGPGDDGLVGDLGVPCFDSYLVRTTWFSRFYLHLLASTEK